MNNIILTFGKHSGKKLGDLPRDYIEWLAQQDIRKQPEVAREAQTFLKEHPATQATKPRSQELGPRPLTYKEASKLGWMAGNRYGNARATMLAARDQDGLLCVINEDSEDEIDDYRLLAVSDNGTISDASFYSQSYAEVETILKRYPRFDGTQILVEVAEREEMEADEKRRRLTFKSKDGKHTIRLTVWARESIDVTIDGRDQGSYLYREPNEEERRDPKWKAATAILESGTEDPLGRASGNNIGLTAERKALVLQKIEEVAKKESK